MNYEKLEAMIEKLKELDAYYALYKIEIFSDCSFGLIRCGMHAGEDDEVLEEGTLQDV